MLDNRTQNRMMRKKVSITVGDLVQAVGKNQARDLIYRVAQNNEHYYDNQIMMLSDRKERVASEFSMMKGAIENLQ